MREAVIVSTARTPIGKTYRGALNNVPSPTLAAHAIREAARRANIQPELIDDCIVGCSIHYGCQTTIGRSAALRAGCRAAFPVFRSIANARRTSCRSRPPQSKSSSTG
ncbi:hypothetical protein [Bradyrhizobium sp. F1.13.3]|uniref:thiolase family protein n=1 Tax=Bradyrhizobium sp. F1.13.3 TaxID=3156351 RepID=UPI0033983017